MIFKFFVYVFKLTGFKLEKKRQIKTVNKQKKRV